MEGLQNLRFRMETAIAISGDDGAPCVNHVTPIRKGVVSYPEVIATFTVHQKVFMKKALYLLPAAMLFFCASVKAQQVNIDSLSLIAQIGQDQLELGKLQNMVYQKTMNKEGAALKSQSSANDNADAAEKLSNDPDNKKLANDASNKAGDAKSDAKNSRKQSGKLDDLNQKIMDLKTKINGEQYKLSLYSPALPAVAPISVP